MSEPFDRAAPPPADDVVERTADWLVGGRLATVLHLGDTPLAYQLSQHGHEVVVAGPSATVVRDPQVQYVRSLPDRLPFAGDSFDAIVSVDLDDRPTALAEYARVLRPGGHLASLHRRHDESIPWLRRLLQIVGRREQAVPPDPAAIARTGLFTEPEVREDVRWEELDLPRVLRLARQRGTRPTDDVEHEVRALFAEYTAHTGSLRMRHLTRSLRATVAKTDAAEPDRADTILFELR